MKMYSPSSRSDYEFCPRSWYLRKNGWVPRTIGYPELCAIGGNAVGKAMEIWNTGLIQGQNVSVVSLHDIALLTSSESIREQINYGRMVSGNRENEFLGQLPELIIQAISILWEQNPLRPYAILSAEQEYAQAGKARSDVVVKRPDGTKIVVDYKCKFGEMQMTWVDKEFAKHFEGEQRLTYTTMEQADYFAIILVLLKPSVNKKVGKPQVIMRTVPVSEQEKSVWLQNTMLSTPYMDHILTIPSAKLVPARTYPHSNVFGDCRYKSACLDYNLDEEQMKLDFIQIKKEK